MNKVSVSALILLLCLVALLGLAGGVIPFPSLTPSPEAGERPGSDASPGGDGPVSPALLEGRRMAAAPDNAASGRFRSAPAILTALHEQLRQRIEERSLPVKLSLYDFATGGQIKIGAHEAFVPASMIKTLLLLTVLEQATRGDLSLQETHPLTESDKYVEGDRIDGTGTLQFAAAGGVYTLEELLSLMVSLSDNVATNILFDRVGPEQIAGTAGQLELRRTAFTRKMYDHRSSASLNRATAFELTRMLVALENREFLSADCRAKGVEMMLETADLRIGRYTGPNIGVANKVGTDSGLIGDMALLYFPARPPVALTIAVVGAAEDSAAVDFIGELGALVAERLQGSK